jgi:hypothetical protein
MLALALLFSWREEYYEGQFEGIFNQVSGFAPGCGGRFERVCALL